MMKKCWMERLRMTKNKEELRIVFLGTPEFALPSLSMLLDEGYHIAAVCTQPTVPGGGGIAGSAAREGAGRGEGNSRLSV